MRGKARILRMPAVSAVMAMAALVVTGCGDDSPTGAEDRGTMEAVVRDDSEGQAVALAGIGAQTSGEVSGEFDAQVTVQVEVDGEWLDLSGITNASAQVELQGGESTVGSADVEARTFDRVRIVVTNATADVDGGSDLGAGPIEVGASLTVAGGGDVVVEYNQPVTVQADATTRLILNINSQAWLTTDALDAGVVTGAAFEGAAGVLVQ